MGDYKLNEANPKTKEKIFILISSVLSWSKTPLKEKKEEEEDVEGEGGEEGEDRDALAEAGGSREGGEEVR